jgi:hypothetical protein
LVEHEVGVTLLLARPAGRDAKGACRSARSCSTAPIRATDPACHDLAWYISLGLCLLGCVVQTGWDEALGDDDALEWWADRAREGGVAVMTRRPSH